MDRLVWLRSNSNDGSWWPAVYCESHIEAFTDFGPRMTKPLKFQAALQILGEEQTQTSIPVVVPITGRDRPIVRLEAAPVG
jgi:hypothetical protein